MIHIYHGDGKGKTTAAFGLVSRQLGYDKNVLIVQFLKDGTSGEIAFFKQFKNVCVMFKKMPKLFYFQLNEEKQAEVALQQHQLFIDMKEHMEAYDCIVLDEILDAIGLGMVTNEEVCSFLDVLEHQEVILTGRNPHGSLQNKADYITEMKVVKHPFQKHIPAREGIEY